MRCYIFIISQLESQSQYLSIFLVQIVQPLSSVSLIFPSAVFLSSLVSLPSFWCLSLWLTLCISFCDWSATDELLCVVFLALWRSGSPLNCCISHVSMPLTLSPSSLPACLSMSVSLSLSLSLTVTHLLSDLTDGQVKVKVNLSVSRLPMDCLHPLPHLPSTCMSHSRAAALSNTL